MTYSKLTKVNGFLLLIGLILLVGCYRTVPMPQIQIAPIIVELESDSKTQNWKEQNGTWYVCLNYPYTYCLEGQEAIDFYIRERNKYLAENMRVWNGTECPAKPDDYIIYDDNPLEDEYCTICDGRVTIRTTKQNGGGGNSSQH